MTLETVVANFGFRELIDSCVLVSSALTTFQNMKLRNEIMRLKLWIAQNFEAKPGANLLDDGT